MVTLSRLVMGGFVGGCLFGVICCIIDLTDLL